MVPEREQDPLRIASMYYLQDMKMEVIARQLNTSRSTISRLIKRARDAGLVEIKLRPSSTRASGLGQSLGDRFGIETYVVSVPDSAEHTDRLNEVAVTSARLLASWFESDMVMGVAWGTTVAAVSRHLPHKPTRGSAVVQLNGRRPGVRGSERRRMDDRPFYLNNPATFSQFGSGAATGR